MKYCPRCKQDLPLDAFGINNSKRDGKQNHCKTCRKIINNTYYKNTPEKNVDRLAWRTRSTNAARRFVTEHLLKNPCVDCSEGDIIVLEFDHVRGIKSFDISFAVRQGYGIEKISAEIDKCEVRCANCHRRQTAKRAGWNKLLKEVDTA